MRPKIAAVITTWFPLSHADVLIPKFVGGFPIDDGVTTEPRCEVVSIFMDQIHENDVGVAFAAEHGIPMFRSIVGALTLGGKELAVDGVLLIGEHGDYAWNERDQQLYPRKYFMEQICGVLAKSGRGVPIFNDKHLSWNWHDAHWMVQRARSLGAAFMGGSSLPFGWRNPWLEIAPGSPLEEAVAIGYSGLDIYGFHTLETLQCMVERRAGGETGVRAVTCFEGEAVWQAARDGLWSRDLAEAACGAIVNKPAGSIEEHTPNPALFRVEYSDGFIGSALMLNGYVEDLAFACRSEGTIHATEFYLQNHRPHGHFSYLGLNVEEMFVTGKPSYPVERTLLTSGILEAALESRYRGHKRVETPYLDVCYQSYDLLKWRPTGTRPTTPPATEPAG